jgi:Fe-S-cluster containining protein
MLPAPNRIKTECDRCGTCCRKGGPSFHRQDRALIDQGTIPSKYLYTIRVGEPVHDNVKGEIIAAETDIIKIKGHAGSWKCIFLDEDRNLCRIYANRPLECRALTCWDTREIEKIYAAERLSRKDLLSTIEGLWDLIEDHQRRCSYDTLRKLLASKPTPETRRQLSEIMQYDDRLRRLIVAQGQMERELLDFVFGRPLTETLKLFGHHNSAHISEATPA